MTAAEHFSQPPAEVDALGYRVPLVKAEPKR
jgi:hypothetical protein